MSMNTRKFLDVVLYIGDVSTVHQCIEILKLFSDIIRRKMMLRIIVSIRRSDSGNYIGLEDGFLVECNDIDEALKYLVDTAVQKLTCTAHLDVIASARIRDT